MNLMDEGLKIQGVIVKANAEAAAEQERRDRMAGKHEEKPRDWRTVNGSRDWYDSGHSAGDFK